MITELWNDHHLKSFEVEKEIFIKNKISELTSRGISIQEQDIPGLWCINEGPEITTNQLHSILLNWA